jgi:hypothetical protein
LKKLFPELKPGNKPSLVWFSDVSDEKTVKKIDGTILQSEPVGIALKGFNCFRVNTLDMPEGELKEQYLKQTPGFYFFDPAAELVQKVVGKRATSLSGFSKLMELTWDKSYSVRLKVFQKQMKDILDRLDKCEVRKQVVDRNRAKLEEKPNMALQKKTEQEEAELAEQKKLIEEDEKGILDACALKPEFLPEAAEEGSR